jgi:hypothetical protein
MHAILLTAGVSLAVLFLVQNTVGLDKLTLR